MPHISLGQSIPPDTTHAVSVSLPTWNSNVGYEEGEDWVLSRMTTGYPRFFIHKSIQAFAADIAAKHGRPGQQAMLFPTRQTASRCLAFVKAQAGRSIAGSVEIVHLVLEGHGPASGAARQVATTVCPEVSAVVFDEDLFSFAKQYWQHTGDGVSSRRAEFYHGLFKEGLLIPELRPISPPGSERKPCPGPRRYQRPMSLGSASEFETAAGNGRSLPQSNADAQESSRFLEERFGRNLDISFVEPAKSAIRRRIAGALSSEAPSSSSSSTTTTTAITASEPQQIDSNARGAHGPSEDDILLFPCGMNAIFNAHRLLLSARGSLKSINFGFPYVDTLKILQKFGPGCVFYGHASEADLDDLEQRLEGGERFLGLFCEFPGNPLLTCPNLERIRHLADRYDFAVVVDETIGTFANINVLPYADIVASSLTKIFSGDCNVMGGSAILNPASRYYGQLKAAAAHEYEDTYWAEDVLFMERNSRDFGSRIERINTNAEAICDVLSANPLVKKVYYPKHNEGRPHYDNCRLPNGGYGGLLSVTFREKAWAVAFYDAIDTAKGPSLGTNFTLTSPYVLLAHYQELDWADSYGADRDLIRISVGLENTQELVATFQSALDSAEHAAGNVQ